MQKRRASLKRGTSEQFVAAPPPCFPLFDDMEESQSIWVCYRTTHPIVSFHFGSDDLRPSSATHEDANKYKRRE
jgi:hypothetical protein